MSYFDYHNGAIPHNKGRILGEFREKDYNKLFEYAQRKYLDIWPQYPHRIAMLGGSRVALVKKTVAYVVVDEANDGSPIVEKWNLTNHRIYGDK